MRVASLLRWISIKGRAPRTSNVSDIASGKQSPVESDARVNTYPYRVEALGREAFELEAQGVDPVRQRHL